MYMTLNQAYAPQIFQDIFLKSSSLDLLSLLLGNIC